MKYLLQTSNILTSYSQFIGKKYSVRRQSFNHEGWKLTGRGGFRLSSGLTARSWVSLIFEFFFLCFLKILFQKFLNLWPKTSLIKMKDLRLLFQQKRNSKIGLCDDLAPPVYYTIKKNYHFHIESLWRDACPRKLCPKKLILRKTKKKYENFSKNMIVGSSFHR